MIRIALVRGAGYKLAYHSEDGRHYGKVGEQGLRAMLSLVFAALAAGCTYADLLIH